VSKREIERVTITLPTRILRTLDRLVDQGYYASRSEAIRHALSNFFATQIRSYGEERPSQLPRKEEEE